MQLIWMLIGPFDENFRGVIHRHTGWRQAEQRKRSSQPDHDGLHIENSVDIAAAAQETGLRHFRRLLSLAFQQQSVRSFF